MVLTPSTMVKLGSPAPDFELKDVTTGQAVSLSSVSAKKAVLIMFICRHCPYVQHIKDGLSQLDKDYRGKDAAIIAISSNDATTHPEDAPGSLKEFVKEQGYSFPFLYDETQEVAKRYAAACTPDFFLYEYAVGAHGRAPLLVYRGQMDDSRPGNGKPVTGKDLRAAMDALLAGKPVSADQRASIGCNIKWKKGNEPEYFA